MNNYADAGNFDRVYNEDGVIAAGNDDPDLAGVYLLGKDIQRIATAGTLEALKKIIGQDLDRLSNEMIKAVRHLDDPEHHVELRLRLLQQGLG